MIFNLSKTNSKKNLSYISILKLKIMLLAIDIGNSRIKAAVFEQNILLEKFIFLKNELVEEINNILNSFVEINNVIISSVGAIEEKDFSFLTKSVNVTFVNHQFRFPFKNSYSTPNTLGIDRMVLAAGASLLYPDCYKLIIDAGTCVTYDYIDDKNVYHGGAISPGIKLRYESLHNYTAKLPLLEKKIPENQIGNSTKESIHSGVINGLISEIDGFINDYVSSNAKFIIILTGGDADFLAKQLKNTIFANSNFLLESLNLLYQYNQKND